MRTSAGKITAVVASAALAVTSVLLFAATAAADPSGPYPSQHQVDRARSQVSRQLDGIAAIRAAMAQANQRLEDAAVAAEIASERYNQAQWELGAAEQASARARSRAHAARARVDSQRLGIASLVTQSYEGVTALSSASAFLTSDSPEQIMAKYSVAQSAGQSMQVRYDEYAGSARKARSTERTAERLQRRQAELAKQAAAARSGAVAAAGAAQAAADRISIQKRHLVAGLAKAQNISVALADQRQSALEQIAASRAAAKARAEAKSKARAAQAAANAAAVAAQSSGAAPGTASQPSSAPSSGSSSGPPVSRPAAGSAAGAIAFAKAQLKEPYQWAAAGPGSWDCSGLTMMAWRAGGVALPHYSAGQYASTDHINVDELRPGDLVFWGSSPGSIHHVAMYLGNGMIIHAPRTGRPVEIDSMYYWIPPNYFGRP